MASIAFGEVRRYGVSAHSWSWCASVGFHVVRSLRSPAAHVFIRAWLKRRAHVIDHSLSLGHDVTKHEASLGDVAVADGHLLCLLRLIAAKDHVAFVDLYDAVSAQLLDNVRSTVAEPARAAAITSAVFVEVWSLARFHTDPGTDVCAWLDEIASRRVADGHSHQNGDAAETPRRHTVPRRELWWTAVATSYDRQTQLTLAALLRRPPARLTAPAGDGPNRTDVRPCRLKAWPV